MMAVAIASSHIMLSFFFFLFSTLVNGGGGGVEQQQQIGEHQSSNIAEILDIGSGIFAVFLMLLSLMAYKNRRTIQLLFVSAAFGIFSLRTLIAKLDIIFSSEIQATTVELALSLSTFAILLLFFIAIVGKKSPFKHSKDR